MNEPLFIIHNGKEERNLLEDLKAWWNIGPLRTLDEYYAEMESYASGLSSNSAATLIEAILFLDQVDEDRAYILKEILRFYCKAGCHSVADELMKRIGPHGPPILLEILGNAHDHGKIETLEEKLDLTNSGEELIVSYICALGTVKNSWAKEKLLKLKVRKGNSEAIISEINIALDSWSA